VAGRLAAASGHGGDGTGSQITQGEELFQELGSLGLQRGEVIDIRVSFCVADLFCTYISVQNHGTKKGNPLDAPSMSPARRKVFP